MISYAHFNGGVSIYPNILLNRDSNIDNRALHFFFFLFSSKSHRERQFYPDKFKRSTATYEAKETVKRDTTGNILFKTDYNNSNNKVDKKL